MGFLLIFFPEEDSTNQILKKNKFIAPSASSQLLPKAQSTIFICALLFLLTLLLFSLSTFEPASSGSNFFPRRQLSKISSKSHFRNGNKSPNSSAFSPALQDMGVLYRRGTKAMNDLIVAHLTESVNVNELKLFLRILQRSSLISRSDLVFIFPSKSGNYNFDAAIHEENDSFLKLIEYYEEIIIKRPMELNSTSGFDPTQIVKFGKTEKERKEPIWGRRIKGINSSEGNRTESTRMSYGSVVGFSVDELDVENSLSAFMGRVTMSFRRWACYHMLLGRVKRNYKHIMLVDVKEILLLGDPMSRIRNASLDSVYLYLCSTRHERKNSEKTQLTHSKPVMTSIVMGGARGVRRLANAMLNDIVRTSIRKNKKKNSVTEFALFNQLVHNEFLLKNVKLIKSTESIPKVSSLSVSNLRPGFDLSMSNVTVFRRGNSNFDVNSRVMKNIVCSSLVDPLIYSDCQ